MSYMKSMKSNQYERLPMFIWLIKCFLSPPLAGLSVDYDLSKILLSFRPYLYNSIREKGTKNGEKLRKTEKERKKERDTERKIERKKGRERS